MNQVRWTVGTICLVPVAEPIDSALARNVASMNQALYEMDSDSRVIVLRTLAGVRSQRGWNLLSAHVWTNHVHVIVEAEVQLEKVMNDFKAYLSRALNRLDGNEPGRRRWARNGSTRWLWSGAARRAYGGFLGRRALKPPTGSLTLAAQLHVAPRTYLA